MTGLNRNKIIYIDMKVSGSEDFVCERKKIL